MTVAVPKTGSIFKKTYKDSSVQSVKMLPLPSDFSTFFENEFGYALLPEQLELHKIFNEWLENGGVHTVEAMRNIGKTDIITIASLCFDLIQNPLHTYIICSKSQNGMKNINAKIREILPKYVKISKTHNNTEQVRTEESTKAFKKEASVSFILANTRVQGMRAMYVIADDLVTHEDSSKAVRFQTQKTYSQLYNICRNIMLIGQWADEEDLFQFLRKQDSDNKKERVKFYAIWWDHVSSLLKEKINLSEEKIAIANTPRQAGLNYYGKFLVDDDIRLFADISVAGIGLANNMHAFIDPSWEGQDSIGVAIGYRDGVIYHALVFEIQGDFSELNIPIMLELISAGVKKIHIEGNNGGLIVAKNMKKYARSNGVYASIRTYKNTKNKQDRIIQTLYPIRDKIILGDNYAFQGVPANPNCVKNWFKATKDHDDGIDALASLIAVIEGVLHESDS